MRKAALTTATLLLALLMIGVGNAAALLDRGYLTGEDPHVELPDNTSTDHHPGQHNHIFCAVVASTPGLPGAAPRSMVAAGRVTRLVSLHPVDAPHTHRFSVLHSRAPPAA